MSYPEKASRGSFSAPISGALGFEELGEWVYVFRTFFKQTQGPKDFLGFGRRAKMPSNLSPRIYPF